MAEADWRDKVPERDVEHWEGVLSQELDVARRADQEGFRYEYIPWHKARSRRELIGKKVARAYWTGGFGELPWGHPHAHTYAFAFKTVRDIGADWIAYEDGTSESFISYDTVCVQRGRDDIE